MVWFGAVVGAVVDENVSWFPDDERVAYVAMMERDKLPITPDVHDGFVAVTLPQMGSAAGGLCRRFAQWEVDADSCRLAAGGCERWAIIGFVGPELG